MSVYSLVDMSLDRLKLNARMAVQNKFYSPCFVFRTRAYKLEIILMQNRLFILNGLSAHALSGLQNFPPIGGIPPFLGLTLVVDKISPNPVRK